MIETLGLIALGVAAAATGQGRVGQVTRNILGLLMNPGSSNYAPQQQGPRTVTQKDYDDDDDDDEEYPIPDVHEIIRMIENSYPGCWYHGTPERKNAADIMYNMHWYVKADHGNPYGVYITRNFFVAKEYAKANGYIIVIQVDPTLDIRWLSDDYYYVPVDAKHTYNYVEGMWPVMCVDTDGFVAIE